MELIELKLLILLFAMMAPEPEQHSDCAVEGQVRILVGWEVTQLDTQRTARVPLYRCAVLL